MSTFDGIVEEFPFIRIDYFRKNPDRPSPLACFLSHVHSDHLQGLESLRSPFIYCSAATRELLLRIEKYPHRMNFSKGILESRKQHYKHLAKLLRPVPLDTPTEIELTPRLRIRVTLLDANHCLGAVMFLIEGDGKAILYTGDIRAETWWVNGLIRNPVLIPYTLGNKRLDKVYLDTTFAVKSNVYRTFPSKAEGLRELLEKVQAYPDDTVFYLRAWTFGYEDVWLALSAALNSRIHVDRYQRGLYQSLSSCHDGAKIREAPFLCGFRLGNKSTPGCLTGDETSRIHSCEPGMFCDVVTSGKAIYITPIVTRGGDGAEVPEVGAGGGGGDLYQSHELELPDESSVEQLEKLCLEQIHDHKILSQTKEALLEAFRSKKALSLDKYGLKDEHDISLKRFIDILSHGQSDDVAGNGSFEDGMKRASGREGLDHQLPNTIKFPYSRHSSYAELCELISAFRPKDVYPCTVDAETWSEEVSVNTLFGHLCSGDDFSHDKYMREALCQGESRVRQPMRRASSSSTLSSQRSSIAPEVRPATPTVNANSIHRELHNDLLNNTASHRHSISSHTLSPLVQKATHSSIPKSKMNALSPERTADMPPKKHFNHMNKEERKQYYAEAKKIWDEWQERLRNEPPPTPVRTERARKVRNSIRRTWYGIEEMRKQGKCLFHNGPLPKWWPTEEEDRYADEDWPNESHDDLDFEYSLPAPKRRPRRAKDCANIVARTDANTNADMDMDINTSQDSQISITISISDSALDSQEQREPGSERPVPQTSNTTATNIYTSDNKADENSNNQRKRSHDVSFRNRARAYRAARSGSYEAWSEVSLLSAGNNHTETETEL